MRKGMERWMPPPPHPCRENRSDPMDSNNKDFDAQAFASRITDALIDCLDDAVDVESVRAKITIGKAAEEKDPDAILPPMDIRREKAYEAEVVEAYADIAGIEVTEADEYFTDKDVYFLISILAPLIIDVDSVKTAAAIYRDWREYL